MTGVTYSPYHIWQAMTKGPRNTSLWWKVVSNLSGAESYDCCWFWVYKKIIDGHIAVGLFLYMDYGRPIGPTEDVCW